MPARKPKSDAKPAKQPPVKARTRPATPKVAPHKEVPPLDERAPVVIARLKEAYPNATVALKFSTPLECLIATMLSAQSTDENVNRVTASLFPKYRTAEDWLAVPESQLLDELRPTGFFNQKTKAVRGACRKIVEDFGGEVPRTIAELITLPGVARKTANIVQGNSYPEEHARDPDAGIAVDTHVRRLAQRLGFSRAERPRQDRARPDGRAPAGRVVRVHVRADRPRQSGVQGAHAALRGVPGERPVPLEPGLNSGREEGLSGERETTDLTAATCPAHRPTLVF